MLTRQEIDKMTEQIVVEAAYAIIKQGEAARRNGTSNPYPTASLHSLLHMRGWLTEDLRIALMRAKPSYAEDQKNFGQGLDTIPVLACHA
jgi:hypothetical protein